MTHPNPLTRLGTALLGSSPLTTLSSEACARIGLSGSTIQWPFHTTEAASSLRPPGPAALLSPSRIIIASPPVHSVTEILRPPTLDQWLVEPKSDAFWQAFWKSCGGPSGDVIFIYVAGCGGLAMLHDLLSGPIFKAGTTSDVLERLASLNATRYASMSATNDKWNFEEGFNDWKLETPRGHLAPSPHSAVVVGKDWLEVRLPHGLQPAAFEHRFAQILRAVAIDHWVRQPHVSRALSARGVDPTVGIRATEKLRRGVVHARETTELVFFRRKCDWTGLITIAESVVAGEAAKGC